VVLGGACGQGTPQRRGNKGRGLLSSDEASRLAGRPVRHMLSPIAASVFALALSMPAHADWRALEGLERDGALVSALALDLDTGAVLEQLNPDRRLTPASLTKLAVAAATLNRWSGDKAFETRLLARGTLHSGELTGDVILDGEGDPTLEYHALLALAVQAASSGVTSVRGRVVVNLAPFAEVGCETHDRCGALVRSDTAFNAPLSSVGIDYGNWCVSVQPTTAGAAALVRGCGVARLPIPVEGAITTSPAQSKKTFWVERATNAGVDVLRVGGQIPIAAARERVYRAMSNPAMGVGLLLRESLREVGVGAPGDVIITQGALPSGVYALAQTEGLVLREQLGRMLRFSNNYIADVLTFDLAADITGRAPAGLADASKGLSEFVQRAVRAQSRTKVSAPLLLSGSGLTPENELSAHDLVALLAYQYHDSRYFPAFYGGLTVPRQAPFGFLRQGTEAWLDRVALKTGTMDEPHSVCGIAGYLRKKSGGWIAFATIVNGSSLARHIPLYKAMEASRTDLESVLARY
jgi:D-alanyl-D-alanine carboxypeptidase/D-alanyl-D-alanine-endopeptidase (penicillin-binding protein 4)